jgi:hypothetical protein
MPQTASRKCDQMNRSKDGVSYLHFAFLALFAVPLRWW